MSEETKVLPEGTPSPPENSSKKGIKKKIAISIAILLLLLLGLLGLYLYHREEDPFVGIAAGAKQGSPYGDEEEAQEGSNGRAAMDISLNGRPVFENGESAGDLNIVNPESNTLYMNVEITLDDTGEVLYDPGAIPPGYYIDNDKLSKVLEAGEYEATAHVNLLDPEDLEAVFNSANFHLVITIEN